MRTSNPTGRNDMQEPCETMSSGSKFCQYWCGILLGTFHCRWHRIIIVTDLIKALLGNSSANTFQYTHHSTKEEAVFSMWYVPKEYRMNSVKRIGIKRHTAV
jgi:hypothetical protein